MTPNGTSAVTERSVAAGQPTPSARPAPGRIDWVDYAKGICIVLVVMMHSVLGVEAATGQTGFMHFLVAFAKPFRMPDFFLISGLFLAVVIDRDWRTYLDRKVVHFAYFYLLWVTIQFGFKAPSFAAEAGWAHVGLIYLQSLIEPFGTLWFIYLLPVFFVVTKATRHLPPLAILAMAALRGLSSLGTDEARGVLIKAFDNPHLEVKVSAIGFLPDAAAETVRSEVTRLLEDPSSEVRLSTLNVLSHLGSTAVG
ncbi:MAG: acyltransferase family protein, partial [Bradyrhizobium sp.]|nr:acyltransferase family protein [Bradyrhizobium sp.]